MNKSGHSSSYCPSELTSGFVTSRVLEQLSGSLPACMLLQLCRVPGHCPSLTSLVKLLFIYNAFLSLPTLSQLQQLVLLGLSALPRVLREGRRHVPLLSVPSSSVSCSLCTPHTQHTTGSLRAEGRSSAWLIHSRDHSSCFQS